MAPRAYWKGYLRLFPATFAGSEREYGMLKQIGTSAANLADSHTLKRWLFRCARIS
jgi:hypothetical protein